MGEITLVSKQYDRGRAGLLSPSVQLVSLPFLRPKDFNDEEGTDRRYDPVHTLGKNNKHTHIHTYLRETVENCLRERDDVLGARFPMLVEHCDGTVVAENVIVFDAHAAGVQMQSGSAVAVAAAAAAAVVVVAAAVAEAS
jgi:hypothetical protein